MLILELPGKRQWLVFTGSVLKTFDQHRQTGPFRKEAGGQIFARITPDIVVVGAITGPDQKDSRFRFGFIPNKRRLKKEIAMYFEKGFHYVGDWHSHPQRIAKPSGLDIQSMKRCFSQSTHELDNFILVIVGKMRGATNLWVGAVNSSKVIALNPIHE